MECGDEGVDSFDAEVLVERHHFSAWYQYAVVEDQAGGVWSAGGLEIMHLVDIVDRVKKSHQKGSFCWRCLQMF